MGDKREWRLVELYPDRTSLRKEGEERKACPFMPDGFCKGADCKMWVEYALQSRDTMLSAGYGRCGLVNIRAPMMVAEISPDHFEKERAPVSGITLA